MDNEQDKYIEQCALAVVQILKRENAVRIADNVVPEGVILDALLGDLDNLGFPISASAYYSQIRPKCIELGYDVTAAGRGQYIGRHGEAVARNIQNARNQIIGRTYNQRKILTAASEAMSLDEGNKYSKIYFGMDLGTASQMFKAIGEFSGDCLLPWPDELHQYLLESKNTDVSE